MKEEFRQSSAQLAAKPPTEAFHSPATGRDQLEKIFERLEQAAAHSLSAEAQKELASPSRKYQESRFYLVFLGQFKRGKTTLINCFLGTEVLPTGVLPLTSIVTIVRYGSEPRALVHFTDGSARGIPPADLPSYVTERGNPRNKKGVAEVEVFFPARRLEEGLCLVDTPGIGSIFEHNTQVAYQFVPRGDAAIFVFSPDAPLSRAELEFLHHLRAHIEKIFFVMNKADQVSGTEKLEVLEFARHTIREQIPAGELRFYAVSARQALEGQREEDGALLEESGLKRLLETLDLFLASHGGDVLLHSTCTSLRRLLHNEILGMEIEARALSLSSEELEQKIRTIERIWESLDQRHREAGHILQAEVRALEASLEKQLDDFVQSEKSDLDRHMQKKLDEFRTLSKRELIRKLEAELRSKMSEILGEWKIKEEQAVGSSFESLTSRFSSEATRIVGQIQQAAAEQFGFSWKAAALPDRLTPQSRFRLELDYLMGWGMGQFPLLLPKPLFLNYFEKPDGADVPGRPLSECRPAESGPRRQVGKEPGRLSPRP